MKKILLSLTVVAVAAVAAVGATTAFFSDTETSTGNTFTAGAIDLTVDNHSWYNGSFSTKTTWEATDLTVERFFDFDDLKPGDWGEDTISLHVENNPAWACVDVTLTSNDDESSTEPELEDGDDPEDEGDVWDGELGHAVEFVWWADDGDNVLETHEEPLSGGYLGYLGEGGSATVALSDSEGGLFGSSPLLGETTYHIGKAWCYGDLGLDPVENDGGITPAVDPGITCNGWGVDNMSQTDSLTADISFYVVQSRNNGEFECGDHLEE